MISTVKREIAISKELHSKIEWACTFSNCTAVIKDKIYLFFNEHEYFYIGNLENKYPLSKLRDFISGN